jgi:hypothetical protein
MILLPLTDYHISINLCEVGKKGNHVKLTKYLTLRYLKEKTRVMVKCEEISLEVEVIKD